MALSQPELCEAIDGHPFLYGRVLSVFHVNVIYNGPGMIDYNPRRFDIMWVRWYDLDNTPVRKSKAAKPKLPRCLDRLVFPPLDGDDSVGFLDPANVLRG